MAVKAGRRQSGFTLVEMLIVVAIIGILAQLSLSTYQKFTARARQTEAKVALSNAYTALQSYYTEHGTYTACLRQAGFELKDQSGGDQKRYYLVGLRATGFVCGPQGGQGCNGYTWNADGTQASTCVTADRLFGANAKVHSAALIPDSVPEIPAWSDINDQDDFKLGARGNISSSTSAWDEWSIDHRKFLINSQNRL